MKQKKLAVALVLSLLTGLCGTAGTVQAKESKLVSRGSIVYRDGGEEPGVYASDFLLLKEKLDTISGEIFSPACYAHVHQWEYRDVNERTHTRHCEQCGEAFDLIDVHKAVREENCTITCQDGEYPGRRYSCECGRQWVEEETHVLVFDEVDEICHRGRCVLEDTEYCQGYEPVLEEHYAYYYVPGSDDAHHERVCIDCGHRVEEECSFTLDIWGESEEPDEGVRYCACGNSRQIEKPGEAEEETDTEESEASEIEEPIESVSENSIVAEGR